MILNKIRKYWPFLVIICLNSGYLLANELELKTRATIVETAKSFLGRQGGALTTRRKSFRFDCSGFVFACYYAAGIDLKNVLSKRYATKDIAYNLYQSQIKNKTLRPKPGDMVFLIIPTIAIETKNGMI